MCRRTDIITRIYQRVDEIHTGFTIDGVLSPCHVWNGPDSGLGRGGGYGRMSLNGQTVAVHLVVFTHFYGYIPSKKQVDHKCNNRLCCNPDHLELVSQKENCKRRESRKKETRNEIGNLTVCTRAGRMLSLSTS